MRTFIIWTALLFILWALCINTAKHRNAIAEIKAEIEHMKNEINMNLEEINITKYEVEQLIK
jgi:hypothetical protein